MLSMHKQITFSKSDLERLLAGEVIDSVCVDGILHRFMLQRDELPYRHYKVYYELYDYKNRYITSLSQIVKARTSKEAVKQIQDKHKFDVTKIAINKLITRS